MLLTFNFSKKSKPPVTNPAFKRVTTCLLRLRQIDLRSESFVFKNAIPRANRPGFASLAHLVTRLNAGLVDLALHNDKSLMRSSTFWFKKNKFQVKLFVIIEKMTRFRRVLWRLD